MKERVVVDRNVYRFLSYGSFVFLWHTIFVYISSVGRSFVIQINGLAYSDNFHWLELMKSLFGISILPILQIGVAYWLFQIFRRQSEITFQWHEVYILTGVFLLFSLMNLIILVPAAVIGAIYMEIRHISYNMGTSVQITEIIVALIQAFVGVKFIKSGVRVNELNLDDEIENT